MKPHDMSLVWHHTHFLRSWDNGSQRQITFHWLEAVMDHMLFPLLSRKLLWESPVLLYMKCCHICSVLSVLFE